jgi:predicted ArsR family transcriptional regulator
LKTPRLGRAEEDVLEALRGGPRTVAEIARALGVTANAVRVHVHTLTTGGLVREGALRPSGRRPSHTYALTAAAESLSGRAYVPLADQLLHAVEARVSPARRRALLRDAGRRLAGGPAEGTLAARVRAAGGRLEDLGTTVTVHRRDEGAEGFVIEGVACPLTALVRAHPEVCLAVEAFVAEVTCAAAHEVCDRAADTPRCRIEVKPA